MPHQATVTAVTGPGRQNTAIVLANITKVEFELGKVIRFIQEQQASAIKEYDLAGVTTVTVVISAGNYSFVIS
jgi:hypothetical protein